MMTLTVHGFLVMCVDREKYLGNLEERTVMLKWTTSRGAGSMTTSNEDERMPRNWSGILRRTNLIVLAFMFLGAPMAHAQSNLEDLQKRKAIAEAETEAIQAETARDEARKKQSELNAPLDPVKQAKGDAVEAANSANAIADAQKAQSAAQSLCTQCIQAAQEEVKKCLESAISQEDKKSCLGKQETRTKTCSIAECKIERAQSGNKSEGLPEKK
jgi:hypothetical protein